MDNIGRLQPSDPYDKISSQPQRGWDLRFYCAELFKRFLISKKTPESSKERGDIEKISKNLSLLLWIGRAQILSPEQEGKIIDQIKDLSDNFRQDDLYEKTNYIVQKIKNMTPKTDILEFFTDIEHKACLCLDENHPCINSEELHEQFEKIIDVMNGKSDKFSLLKLEREMKDIKNIYFNDPSQISLLIHNLQQITHQ